MQNDRSHILADPKFQADLAGDESLGVIAKRWGVAKSFVFKHRGRASGGPRSTSSSSSPKAETTELHPNGGRSVENYQLVRDRAVTLEDWREWVRSTGDDPEKFNPSVRSIAYGDGLWSNKLAMWPKVAERTEPEWPLIQPAQPVEVKFPTGRVADIARVDRTGTLRLAMKAGDTQIGFRVLDDGSVIPFHDDGALDLFVLLVGMYRPEKVTILGDLIDLPSQSRWAQEAAFARTTQMSLDRTHAWLAGIRAAAPEAEIVIVEGNHDMRLQTYVQNNAIAAFGLRPANLPASWPVMSLPNLLRLDELDIKYVDAYPAGADWDNARTRNVHGTRSNSKGSTMAQYAHELPHINTWAGHTHRAEVVYRTVLGERGEPVESYAANPGVLCRTDGAVPSVHAGLTSSGAPAHTVEDWQQGFGMLWFDDEQSIPQVYRIRDGATVIDGRLISVDRTE